MSTIQVTVEERNVAFAVLEGGVEPAFGGVLVKVNGPTAVEPVTLTTAPFQIAIDPSWSAGSYIVTAQAVDANGVVLGQPLSQTITIGSVAVQYPLAITVGV